MGMWQGACRWRLAGMKLICPTKEIQLSQFWKAPGRLYSYPDTAALGSLQLPRYGMAGHLPELR